MFDLPNMEEDWQNSKGGFNKAREGFIIPQYSLVGD